MAEEGKEKTGAKTPAPTPVAKAKEIPNTDDGMGDYTGELTVLTQDQMLGQGGGEIFYEILDEEGRAREHRAMPTLLRDRPRVKAALKTHAVCTRGMAKKMLSVQMEDESDEENEAVADDLLKLEEADTDALLTIAYFSFKRTDPTVRKLGEKEGKESIADWMDEKQLREIVKVALGMNKFELPPMGAGL